MNLQKIIFRWFGEKDSIDRLISFAIRMIIMIAFSILVRDACSSLKGIQGGLYLIKPLLIYSLVDLKNKLITDISILIGVHRYYSTEGVELSFYRLILSRNTNCSMSRACSEWSFDPVNLNCPSQPVQQKLILSQGLFVLGVRRELGSRTDNRRLKPEVVNSGIPRLFKICMAVTHRSI